MGDKLPEDGVPGKRGVPRVPLPGLLRPQGGKRELSVSVWFPPEANPEARIQGQGAHLASAGNTDQS